MEEELMFLAYERGVNLSRPVKKKPVTNLGPRQAPPLRHIGHIVIWEGNYTSDINSIGEDAEKINQKPNLPCSSTQAIAIHNAGEGGGRGPVSPPVEPGFGAL